MEKQIQIDGQSICYRLSGAGDPVLLVHGFAEDGEIWKGLAQALENEFTVIVPDLPGSGRSGNLTRNDTSMEDLAAALLAILEQESITGCNAIGHSMGGYVLLAMADKRPTVFTRLGLFHSTALPDGEEKKMARLKNVEFIERNGARKFLQQSVPKLFSPETNQKIPTLITNIIQSYSNFSTNSLVQYTLAMRNRPDRTHILKDFPGPVLFIIGESDTAVPPEQSFRECQLPGISYIYVGSHSAHMGMLEEPEFCTAAVKYFLSGN